MFIDKVKIKVISGAGGNGMVAWRREKYVDKGGPAGGDGGRGGDIYLVADESISTLLDFKYKSIFKAIAGENGRIKNQHGKCGEDLFIHVPLGTMVRDVYSKKIIADFTHSGEKVMVAKGGRGGRGNARFNTSTRRAPQFCEPGEPAIERELELELKLIADVGLLGLPNAGKSTFISAVSAAKPKIADYPFTTLVPHLGVVKKPDGDGFVMADIPGLIEGASDGVGLGFEFLRHVERTRFLIHLVDITLENPVENYLKINQELKKYGGRLGDIFQITVLNKIDAVDEDTVEKVKKELKEHCEEVFAISAVTGENVDRLMHYVIQKVDEIPPPHFDIEIAEDMDATNNDDSDYSVMKIDKNTFLVRGGKVQRLASVTDTRNPEQIIRLQNILNNMGVFEAIKQLGAKDGDCVIVSHVEFYYYE
ncbi:MAG: GTPase ObgE [Candidatus Gastranaerophilales bacterium]|nr:GTPase ObgE [Candidatus Gastranaerophilales bacterium]